MYIQVPGLFEGDEYSTLMTQCKEGSQREGLMLDSSEELYKWFTQQVIDNICIQLHYKCTGEVYVRTYILAYLFFHSSHINHNVCNIKYSNSN